MLDERFEVPAGFDPACHLAGGRAFRTGPETPVARVRYRPPAAAWAAERWPEAERGSDGSVTVCHLAADPDWVVSHVLQYGPDAELLSPDELRARVQARLVEIIEAWATDRGAPTEG